jgi:hypothetical protein
VLKEAHFAQVNLLAFFRRLGDLEHRGASVVGFLLIRHGYDTLPMQDDWPRFSAASRLIARTITDLQVACHGRSVEYYGWTVPWESDWLPGCVCKLRGGIPLLHLAIDQQFHP